MDGVRLHTSRMYARRPRWRTVGPTEALWPTRVRCALNIL
jgi:hypothetical protein